jgi:hypothetical protein
MGNPELLRDPQGDVLKNPAIYITTTRPNYYLCKALIASLEVHADRPAIYILPEDDYAKETMFGYPVWRPQDPRVLALNYYFTKLRIFWGPAERFLYLDADMLALKDIRGLLQFIDSFKAPFVMVYNQTDHAKKWKEETQIGRADIHRQWVGDADWIRRFDPSYDIPEAMPFESGFFCASRNAINHDAFLDTFERAVRFNSAQGEIRALTQARRALFNQADQGFLNYFTTRNNIKIERLDDVCLWGGNALRFDARDQLKGPFAGLFCHWAGCPRPGPWPIRLVRIPAHREWRKHYFAFCRSRRNFRGMVRDMAEDLWRCTIQRLSVTKRAVLRQFARGDNAGRKAGQDRS